MHIFLSGVSGVGKSTLIKKALHTLAIKPLGFVTLPGNFQEDGSSEVFIFSANAKELSYTQQNLVGRREDNHKWFSYPQIFDTVGVDILTKIGPPLILMDELGFMEAEAKAFRQQVIKILQQHQIPVLGVIKPRSIPFLDEIRALPGIKILDITQENRDDKYLELLELLKQIMPK